MTHQSGPDTRAEPAAKSEDGEDPRVRFAGERTMLAWLRTSLALMGFGFVVARFGLFLRELSAVRQIDHSSPGWSHWIGIALVLVGVVVTALAAWEHRRFLRRLDRRQPYEPPHWSLGLLAAALFILIGLGMAAYLVLVLR